MTDNSTGFDLHAIGIILLVVGIVGLIASLVRGSFLGFTTTRERHVSTDGRTGPVSPVPVPTPPVSPPVPVVAVASTAAAVVGVGAAGRFRSRGNNATYHGAGTGVAVASLPQPYSPSTATPINIQAITNSRTFLIQFPPLRVGRTMRSHQSIYRFRAQAALP